MRVDTNKRAVFDLPSGADIVALEIVPAAEIFAVEQQLPASLFFGGGKGIKSGAASGVGIIVGRGDFYSELFLQLRFPRSAEVLDAMPRQLRPQGLFVFARPNGCVEEHHQIS